MKQLLLAITLLGSLNTFAKDSERVILADSKTFVTEVSVSTVRCSHIGYGSAELKINLAGLDGWTIFDHSNAQVGEFGEPCMTAGMCKRTPTAKNGFTIDDLIQNNPGNEVITVQRQLIESKQETKDGEGNEICQRSLVENLSTTVRGIKFAHTRYGAHEIFPIEACRK